MRITDRIVIQTDQLVSVTSEEVFKGTTDDGWSLYGAGDCVTLKVRRNPETGNWGESWSVNDEQIRNFLRRNPDVLREFVRREARIQGINYESVLNGSHL